MSRERLTDKLREQYVQELPGEKPKRTLEDALQEALDNTTPEIPGQPDYTHYERGEDSDAEWI